MNNEQRRLEQDVTIDHADMERPERGKMHVHFHIHPWVSLILAFVFGIILLVSWAVYATMHTHDFVASTVGLFHDGMWVARVIGILGLLWLGFHILGVLIERVVQPLIHALHMFLTAIGQGRRNRVLAHHDNWAYTEDGQFHQVDHTTYHLRGDLQPPRIEAPAVPQLRLPEKVMMIDTMRRWNLRPDNLFLALGKGGQELSCTLDGLMHVAHDAPTGGGKTAQFYAEIIMLLKLNVQVILANPHFAPVGKKGDDWRPIARAIELQGKIEIAPSVLVPGLIRKCENIRNVLRWLSTREIDRRFDMQAEGDYSYNPIYLFIDEWAMVVSRFPDAAGSLTDVLQRGRAVEVCVDTNSQGFLVADTELKGSSRENYNTAFHMGGSIHSGSKLLDMPVKDMNTLFKAEQVTLGTGVAMLRNNESVPQAQLVRLPYADNNYCYYMLGRADDWTLASMGNGVSHGRVSVSESVNSAETLETAPEAISEGVYTPFPVSTLPVSAPVNTDFVNAETRETLRKLHSQGMPHGKIAEAVGLAGRKYPIYKQVCKELGLAPDSAS